jgi:hypothetical protein
LAVIDRIVFSTPDAAFSVPFLTMPSSYISAHGAPVDIVALKVIPSDAYVPVPTLTNRNEKTLPKSNPRLHAKDIIAAPSFLLLLGIVQGQAIIVRERSSPLE